MKKLYLLLLLTIFIWNCSQDKSIPNGYEALIRDNKGELVTATLKAVDTAELWKTPSTGYNEYFLLGQYNNIRTHTIMRFYPSVYLDSATVESAELILSQSNSFGQGDSIRVTIYPVLSPDWLESGVTWKMIEPLYDAADPIINFKIGNADTTLISVPFPADRVNEWILAEDLDANIRNNGILFHISQAEFMAQFPSSDLQVSEPYLRLIYKNEEGNTDTTDVIVTEDATLYEYENTDEENRAITGLETVHIDNLQGYRAMIRFDLSAVPIQASVHQAILSLPIDTDKSYSKEEGINIKANVVLLDTTLQNPTWYNTNVSVDSALQYLPQTIVAADVSVLSFADQTNIQYMSRIVQNWLLERNPNHGLLLQSSEYGFNPYSIHFYTGKIDSSRIPELKITYSLPPAAKF